MARRYSNAESQVKERIAARKDSKKAPEQWSSAPRYWPENGQIYLCKSCTVELLLELGVSLETIANSKRFDWRKASVETIEQFEALGGWLGDVLPPPAPPAPPAAKAKPTSAEPTSADNKDILKALAGMAQQMQANQAAIGKLFKMITE